MAEFARKRDVTTCLIDDKSPLSEYLHIIGRYITTKINDEKAITAATDDNC